MIRPTAVRSDLLVPGFDKPVDRAQSIYRVLLEAMAEPGKMLDLDTGLEAVRPLNAATLGIVFCLLDADTPVWLDAAADRPAVQDNIRFHCGCPMVEAPADGAFAVVADPADLPELTAFSAGDDTYPDRSATLIIQVDALDAGERVVLRGPGIEGETRLSVTGLPRNLPEQWRANGALYPAGVDLILTAGNRVTALPRTTRLGTT